MRQPNPLQHLLPRLAVPTVLALALPLQTAAAHHHGETNAPTLHLAQSGGAPAVSQQPASPPDGTDDTGMPEEADQAAQEAVVTDGPESPDESGPADTAATDGDGAGNGSEAEEEAPRTDTPEGSEGEDGSRSDQEALGDEETRAAEEEDGGQDGEDQGDEDHAADDGSRDDDAGPHGRVARAAFTSGIEDREPVDHLETVDAGNGEVLFFTEIRDHEGGTIIHQWRYQGWDMGEVRFDVDGPRWRVWSSKTLRPEWTGPWTVRVVDQDGRLLDAYHLRVTGGD